MKWRDDCRIILEQLMRVFLALSLLLILSAASQVEAKQVVGYIEPVTVTPPGVRFTAKMDTGALKCSLHATGISQFDRNGEPWVRFTIRPAKGASMELTRKLVRIAKVKRHKRDVQKRPVVELEVCLKDVRRTVQVNLINRSGLNYRMLIGRDFLKGYFMVDPELKKTSQPSCAER